MTALTLTKAPQDGASGEALRALIERYETARNRRRDWEPLWQDAYE